MLHAEYIKEKSKQLLRLKKNYSQYQIPQLVIKSNCGVKLSILREYVKYRSNILKQGMQSHPRREFNTKKGG